MDQEAAAVFRVPEVVVIPQALHHHKAIMVVPPQKPISEERAGAVALLRQAQMAQEVQGVLVVLAQPLL